MKKNLIYLGCICMGVVYFMACKSPYTPTPISSSNSFLVVEGVINLTDSTFINLSRTVSLSTKVKTKPELKATVSIESSQGTTFPLKELGNGVYAAPPLALSATNQYRLRIKTASGGPYVSDFTEAKVSPPIDTITWKPQSNALEIYASAHDPSSKSRYYRWDYTEEWRFHTAYNSQWVSDGLKISLRPINQNVYFCFAGDSSINIIVGSSSKLNQDVINQQLIATIASSAEKLSVRYSILVKQYALTKEAYDYWTLLKKNTEQLGSIFDAQPSASFGNVHNTTNPAEVVIGYISAGTVATKRIFIDRSELPVEWRGASQNCELDTIWATPNPINYRRWQDEYLNYKSSIFIKSSDLIPVNGVGGNQDKPEAWESSPRACADCTTRGKLKQPAYWK